MSAESNAIAGNGNIADYDVITGGILAARQNPFDAADMGTLNNGTTGTGKASAKGTIAPPGKNSSTYTPPRWLVNATQAGNANKVTAAMSTAPVVGGQPAAGPGQAGAVKSRMKGRK